MTNDEATRFFFFLDSAALLKLGSGRGVGEVVEGAPRVLFKSGQVN